MAGGSSIYYRLGLISTQPSYSGSMMVQLTVCGACGISLLRLRWVWLNWAWPRRKRDTLLFYELVGHDSYDYTSRRRGLSERSEVSEGQFVSSLELGSEFYGGML